MKIIEMSLFLAPTAYAGNPWLSAWWGDSVPSVLRDVSKACRFEEALETWKRTSWSCCYLGNGSFRLQGKYNYNRKVIELHYWTSAICYESSSEAIECTSLFVCSVVLAQFLTMAKFSKGFFLNWPHSANLSWARMAANGSISTQQEHTTCGNRGVRSMSNRGQTIAEHNFIITMRPY